MEHHQGHNWEKADPLSFSKIANHLSDEELLKFNLACKFWIDGAREGKTPQESARIYTNLAHKKLKMISKDLKPYEEIGKVILSNTHKLPHIQDIIRRRIKNIKKLDFKSTSSLELLHLFEAVPGNFENLTTLDLTHIRSDKNLNDLMDVIKDKCPYLEDLHLPE